MNKGADEGYGNSNTNSSQPWGAETEQDLRLQLKRLQKDNCFTDHSPLVRFLMLHVNIS